MRSLLVGLSLASAAVIGPPQDTPAVEVRTLKYASHAGTDLMLDLYLPPAPMSCCT